MLSTTDFEKLLFLYKTEGKNMSIQTFCVNNGVNYRLFDKWFCNTHKDIGLIYVVGFRSGVSGERGVKCSATYHTVRTELPYDGHRSIEVLPCLLQEVLKSEIYRHGIISKFVLYMT